MYVAVVEHQKITLFCLYIYISELYSFVSVCVCMKVHAVYERYMDTCVYERYIYIEKKLADPNDK